MCSYNLSWRYSRMGEWNAKAMRLDDYQGQLAWRAEFWLTRVKVQEEKAMSVFGYLTLDPRL